MPTMSMPRSVKVLPCIDQADGLLAFCRYRSSCHKSCEPISAISFAAAVAVAQLRQLSCLLLPTFCLTALPLFLHNLVHVPFLTSLTAPSLCRQKALRKTVSQSWKNQLLSCALRSSLSGVFCHHLLLFPSSMKSRSTSPGFSFIKH